MRTKFKVGDLVTPNKDQNVVYRVAKVDKGMKDEKTKKVIEFTEAWQGYEVFRTHDVPDWDSLSIRLASDAFHKVTPRELFNIMALKEVNPSRT